MAVPLNGRGIENDAGVANVAAPAEHGAAGAGAPALHVAAVAVAPEHLDWSDEAGWPDHQPEPDPQPLPAVADMAFDDAAVLPDPEEMKVGAELLKKRMRNAFITLEFKGLSDDAAEAQIIVALAVARGMHPKYLVFGVHVGTHTHVKHCHFLLEFDHQVSFRYLKSHFPRGHIEARRGSASQCKVYCNKDHRLLADEGTMSRPGGKLGSVMEEIDGGHDLAAIARDHPEEFLKYHAGIRAAAELLQVAPVTFTQHDLYPWQRGAWFLMDLVPDERTVHWYTDLTGGAGKTWFCRKVCAERKALYVNNNKTADIAHAYNGERIVLFDLCRAVGTDGVNYAAIESVKNGMIFSGKYDSRAKIFANPHVFVFANYSPDLSKLSHDRWDVHDISRYADN